MSAKPKYLDRVNGARSTGRFTIPAEIARRIPVDAQFVAELTDQGVLLRFVGIASRDESLDDGYVPAWTKGDAA